MIHISVIELGVACALVVLIFLIPLLVKRSYARLNKRMKVIEDKISKKQ